MTDPTTLPMASDGRCPITDVTTTTSCEVANACQLVLEICSGMSFLPLSASGKQRDGGVGNFRSFGDDSGVIDEHISTTFKNEESA